jgi:glucose-1-phosphate thymidylyltransferase
MRNPNAFAYCVSTHSEKILEIVEKSTISENPEMDPLVVGTFWFRDGENLLSALNESLSTNYRVNGEIYVGTSINLLIKKGLNFQCFDVDNWISFGDPFELELYHWWEELLNHVER